MKTTFAATLVLEAIDRDARYGFDIMDLTGLPSGTVYPILRRFEKNGFVRSKWEDAAAAHEDGRPRRRNYSLTGAGRAALVEARERIAARSRLFSELSEAE